MCCTCHYNSHKPVGRTWVLSCLVDIATSDEFYLGCLNIIQYSNIYFYLSYYLSYLKWVTCLYVIVTIYCGLHVCDVVMLVRGKIKVFQIDIQIEISIAICVENIEAKYIAITASTAYISGAHEETWTNPMVIIKKLLAIWVKSEKQSINCMKLTSWKF